MTKSTKPHILFVVQELNAGGAAYLCVRWIKRLVNDYEIDLLVVGHHDEKMLDELPKEVSVFISNESLVNSICDKVSSHSPLGILPFFLRNKDLEPFHREYQAVLATSILASWQACTVFSMVSSTNKILFLVDEALATHRKDALRKKNIVELSVLVADYVISVSRGLYLSMVKQCEALNNKPLDVMWPIVEIHHTLKSDLRETATIKRLEVLTIARLTPGKKILESLHLHHALKKLGLDFVWHIVGEGPQYAFLKKEIRRLDMGNCFFLEGFHKNVQDWMSRCDIFALLSDSEGCPTVVIEALQCNCVVLTTRVNGVDELIVNEQTGIIVDCAWDLIQDQLSRLVVDGELRAKLKNNVMRQPLKLNAESDLRKLISMIDSPQKNSKAALTVTPSVSILIPTYHQAHCIDQAISSALMQDFAALEVIVIDDASSDETEMICQKWLADPRFRYVKNSVNLGRVANYRHALYDLAHGEWALMLDGDDYLITSSFIRTAWETAQRYQEVGVVFVQAGHRVRFLDGSSQDVDILPEIEMDEMLVQSGEYLKFVYEESFFTHLGILFNRSAAINNACYTADISSSDMASFLSLSLKGPVVLLNQVAGCWVQHGHNASANLRVNDIADNVKIFRQIADLAIKKGLITKSDINPGLTRYEAQTLAFLFASTIGKTTYQPLDVFRIIPMVITINPKLIFNLILIKATIRAFIYLSIVLVNRWI